MTEQERPDFDLFDERFRTLAVVQAELERRGYYFYPVEKEHTEGLVTGPLLHKLRTQVKKRGFGNVATRVAITFSGFAQDEREVYEIPEARAYWRALDDQLPELPALLAVLPAFRYNGPGMALTLLGEIDAVRPGRTPGSYTAHVADAAPLLAAAVRRIQQAGRKYHLPDAKVQAVIEHFTHGASTP